MFKKTISIILVIAMCFSLVITPDYAYAGQGDSNTPVITSINSISWDGKEIKEGDQEFFIEARGQQLDGLSAIICSYDSNSDEYTQLGIQTDHKYIGKDKNGDEWHIYQIATYEALTSDTYYLFLADDQQQKYKDVNSNNYMLVYSDTYNTSISTTSFGLTEISSDTVSYNTELYVYDLDQSIPVDELKLAFYTLTVETYGDYSDITKVGEASEIELYESTGGANLVRGDIVFYSNANIAGKQIYAGLTYNDETVYTFEAVLQVVDGATATLGQFDIPAGINIPKSDENGHGHNKRSFYKAADGSAFAINNALESFDFSMTASNISNKSLLAANGASLSNVNILSEGNGIYSIEGTITASNVTSSSAITFTYDNKDIYTLPIERYSYSGYINSTCNMVMDVQGYSHIPDNNILTVTIDTFGNYDGDFSAELYTFGLSGDAQYVSDLIVSKTDISDNKIVLDIEIPDNLDNSSNYYLEIKRNGEIPECVQYFYDWDTQKSQIICDEMSIIFYFAVSETLDGLFINNVDIKNGIMYIYGNQFNRSDDYTVNLIKRGKGATLSSIAQTLDSEYVSENMLTVSKASIETLPAGWYTVYVTCGDNQVNGFCETAIIPEDESAQIIAPKATINNNDAYTKDREVKINIEAAATIMSDSQKMLMI